MEIIGKAQYLGELSYRLILMIFLLCNCREYLFTQSDEKDWYIYFFGLQTIRRPDGQLYYKVWSSSRVSSKEQFDKKFKYKSAMENNRSVKCGIIPFIAVF